MMFYYSYGFLFKMSLNKVGENGFYMHAAIFLFINLLGIIPNSTAAVTSSPMQSIVSFLPSPVKYFIEDVKHPNAVAKVETDQVSEINSKPDRSGDERGNEGRFGYPISGAEMNYGGVHGIYPPAKIDLGGVLIGAIIGFGAVVILPKLLHIISSPPSHQGYSRGSDMTSSLANVIDRVDFALHELNVNSTVCIERAVCQALRSSPGNFVDSMTRSLFFTYLIEGSKIKRLLEASHTDDGCNHLIMKCPMSQEVITNGIRAIINV